MVLYSLSERSGYRVVVWLVRPQKSPLCTLDIPYSSLGETTWAHMTFTAITLLYVWYCYVFKEDMLEINCHLLYVCFVKPYLKVAAAWLIKHCNKGRFCILVFQPCQIRMCLQPRLELGSKTGQQKEEVSKNRSTRRLGGQTGSIKTQQSPLKNSWYCQG